MGKVHEKAVEAVITRRSSSGLFPWERSALPYVIDWSTGELLSCLNRCLLKGNEYVTEQQVSLHGADAAGIFNEYAYSWRKELKPLHAAEIDNLIASGVALLDLVHKKVDNLIVPLVSGGYRAFVLGEMGEVCSEEAVFT